MRDHTIKPGKLTIEFKMCREAWSEQYSESHTFLELTTDNTKRERISRHVDSCQPSRTERLIETKVSGFMLSFRTKTLFYQPWRLQS